MSERSLTILFAIAASCGEAGSQLSTSIGQDPDVATDPAGNAMTVWWQVNEGATHIWAARHEVGGDWGVPELVDTDESGGAYPQVAFDGQGNAVVVWWGACGITANRFVVGEGWGSPVCVGDSTAFSFGLHLAVDPDGNSTVVWQDGDPSPPTLKIWANRFEPGTGWSNAVVLDSASDGGLGPPQVAAGPDGTAMAVWGGGVGASWYSPAAGWAPAPSSMGFPLSGQPASPGVVIDHQGIATVAWNGPTIMAARFSPITGWQPPTAIAPEGGEMFGIAIDANDTITVVSQADGNIFTTQFSDGWMSPVLHDAHYANGGVVAASGESVAVAWLHFIPRPDLPDVDGDHSVWTMGFTPASGWSAPAFQSWGDEVAVAVDPDGVETIAWSDLHGIWARTLSP